MAIGFLTRPKTNEERYSYIETVLNEERDTFTIPTPIHPVEIRTFHMVGNWQCADRDYLQRKLLPQLGLECKYVLNCNVMKAPVLILDTLSHELMQLAVKRHTLKMGGRNVEIRTPLEISDLQSILVTNLLLRGFSDTQEAIQAIFTPIYCLENEESPNTSVGKWGGRLRLQYLTRSAMTQLKLTEGDLYNMLPPLTNDIDLLMQFLRRDLIIPNLSIWSLHDGHYYYILLPQELWTLDSEFIWLGQRFLV